MVPAPYEAQKGRVPLGVPRKGTQIRTLARQLALKNLAKALDLRRLRGGHGKHEIG